jgi:hypothetical protein
MTYVPVDPQIGTTPLLQVDATARHPIGTVKRFTDPVLGEGEFIYLPGVAATAIGSAVTYDIGAGTTTILPNTANLAQPVAVAMSANTVVTSFAWYQIGGQATVLTNGTVADGDKAFISATAGQLFHTATAGKQILNATFSSANGAAGTNLTFITIDRPFAQGQIT